MVTREHYEKWRQEMCSRVKAEEWPEALVDLEAPQWDYTMETPLMTRARKELYNLMIMTMDSQKHYTKIKSGAAAARQEDAQALWRVIHKYFAIGKQNGDLDKLKQQILKTSMWELGINVTDYGLECLRLEKTKSDMGVPSNEQLELIPQYLKGLSRSFTAVRDEIKGDIERGTEYTLQEVMEKVEKRAVTDGTTDKISKKEGQVYNGLAANQKTGRGRGARGKTWKRKAQQLKQEVVNLEYQAGRAKEQLGANVTAGQKECRFGAKCWGKGCANKHPAGWKPRDPTKAVCGECKRTGHTTEEHGRCFKCKKKGHMAKDCTAAASITQNVQVVAADAEPQELYVVDAGEGDFYL